MFFHSHKVDSATFVYEYSVSKKEIDDTKKILENASGKDVNIFASHTVGKNSFNYTLKRLAKNVNLAKEWADKHGLKTNFISGDEDLLQHIEDKTITRNYDCICSVNGVISQVDWTGAFDFCPFIRINGASKQEILVIQNKIKTLPICSRCCGLVIGDKK